VLCLVEPNLLPRRSLGKGLRECASSTVHLAHARLKCPGVKIVDAHPMFAFSKGAPNHPIKHLHFESPKAVPVHNGWQKPEDVMVEILKAYTSHRKGDPAPRVLDPCMGWGTTGCAAVRLGYEFVGIEVNPQRFKIAKGDILDRAKRRNGK
jgi:hypothetical protein